MKLGRVHAMEWVTGLAGLLLLIAVFAMPWFGDENGAESMPVIHVIVALAGLTAIALPLIVAASKRTNVPITYETFVATLGSLALLLVVIRLIWAPDGGLGAGAWVGLVASAVMATWAWRSVSRGG